MLYIMYVEQPYYYYFVINFYLRMFIKNALFLLSLSLSLVMMPVVITVN